MSGQGDPRREASSVLRSDETVRFNACAGEWVCQVAGRVCEYPLDIFTILGIA